MSETALRVNSVDFLKGINAKLHHTSDFMSPALIVRRGQGFKLRLNLTRDYNPQDKVVIQLSLGDKPLQAKETLVLLPLQQDPKPGRWSASITDTSHHQCEAELRTAPEAIVGKYSLTLKIGDDYTYRPTDNDFYLLFNPWCEGDDVYLSDEDARQEYVLNDTGYIYVGHADAISGRPWNFGQFEEGVLEVCMELLDRRGLRKTARRDAVRVARAMSALVNANDDQGVLVGNWSGNYPQGTSPNKWTGSSAILLQYGKAHVPVRFGQCWVFSGVLTTVMRCLGIPARSVTNFSSAHDTDGNLSIDIYMNQQGERLNDITADSVWNFHVWNEVWMKRPDLPQGYEGWQAIDSTPQEKSEGVFQCGPSPLKAIKHGEVHIPHDTRFVFAEVNADQVIWRMDNPASDWDKATKVMEYQRAVGKNISTKAMGQDRRQDITLQYKFPEGSPEERKVMEKACAMCLPDTPIQVPQYVQVDFQSSGSVRLGSPISLGFTLQSLFHQPLSLVVMVAAQLQAYNGKTMATVKTLMHEATIQSQKCTSVPMEIAAADYLSLLSKVNDDLHLRVTIMVQSSNPPFVTMKNIVITFEFPSITVDLPATAKLGEPFSGTFTFKNTTGVTMENCKLLVEGLGLFKLATFDQGTIPVGRIFRSEINCTPYRNGRRKIIAKITSDQISGITAEGIVNID